MDNTANDAMLADPNLQTIVALLRAELKHGEHLEPAKTRIQAAIEALVGG